MYFTNLQTFKTPFKGEIKKVLHESSVEDCHLVMRFEIAVVAGGRFERVGCTKLLRKSPNYISFETFLLPHVFKTPMHLWDQYIVT